MWLNPSMRRWPAEALLVGHMVLAYGELELMVAQCLGMALGNEDAAMRMMFRILGESYRIGAADAIMRGWYESNGLSGEYGLAIGATKKCIALRNQYAHCHWGDDEKAGLFFTNLQEPAKASEKFEFWWRHIDFSLLKEQVDYFDYAADGLRYPLYEVSRRLGKIAHHAFPKPTARKPPLPHNNPAEHIPPWLSPEFRQLHIERFRAQ